MGNQENTIAMVDKPKMHLDEDTCLMLKAADGDEKSYNKLHKKYFPILVSYATSLNGRRISPEDIAQEVLTRVWEHRARYYPRSTVKTYLFGYARNVLLEKKLTAYREVVLDFDSLSKQPLKLLHSDTVNQNGDSIKSIKMLMAKLPDKQCQIFELVYIDGFSVTEIAKLFQYSPASIYSNLYRAKKRLRELVNRFHNKMD